MVATIEQQVSAVMDQMPYGLYIIGTCSLDGEANGMMADWVTQVSFEPRQIAVSLENDAHSLENIRQTNAFTLNLLGQDYEGLQLAKHFAQPYFDSKILGRPRPSGDGVHHKLEDLPYFRSASGCPVLGGGVAWAECRAQQFVAAGDHTLVIATVAEGQVLREADVLTSTYTGWPYSG